MKRNYACYDGCCRHFYIVNFITRRSYKKREYLVLFVLCSLFTILGDCVQLKCAK